MIPILAHLVNSAIGYPPTAIGYPPAAIIGRIGHSEFFFLSITAPPAFLNPLDALIPKIPLFSFFADFWVWVTSEAWGLV